MDKFIKKYKTSSGIRDLLDDCLLLFAATLGFIFIFLNLSLYSFDKEIIIFDNLIISLMTAFHTDFLTQIMLGISFLGAQLIIFLTPLIFIILILQKQKRAAIYFSALVVTSYLLNFLLKLIYQRPRPTSHLAANLFSYSFPSGHSMVALTFYAVIIYLILPLLKNKTLTKPIIISLTFLILLIGLSRIYLGVHYPSDVLAGYSAGLALLTTSLMLQKILLFYREISKQK